MNLSRRLPALEKRNDQWKWLLKRLPLFRLRKAKFLNCCKDSIRLHILPSLMLHLKAPMDKPNRFGKLAEVSLSILRYLALFPSVFMLSMLRNSNRTTSIQMRAILFAPYGIIELFSKKLLTAKLNTPTRWKSGQDGKRRLYICGQKHFTRTDKKSG